APAPGRRRLAAGSGTVAARDDVHNEQSRFCPRGPTSCPQGPGFRALITSRMVDAVSVVIHSARKLDAAGEVDGFWMRFDGGAITATGHGEPPAADEAVDAHGRWLVPGFIDLHTHGGGGFAVDAGLESILGAV